MFYCFKFKKKKVLKCEKKKKKNTYTQVDHPQAKLTKFGYRSKRKAYFVKKRILLYFCDLLNLLSKYGNFIIKIPQTKRVWGFFFHKYPLNESHWIIISL